MARVTEKLTTRALARLAQELPEQSEVWDSELSGYHVRAYKAGLSLRLSYYNRAGKRRVLTLGRYGELSAAQGRDAAREALAAITQGHDPRDLIERSRHEAKRQRQQTLRAYLEGPYTTFQLRKKDGAETLKRIGRSFAAWLDRPMTELGRADVEAWQAEQEAVEKPRTFGTLKRDYDALCALLNHAAAREVIPVNPLKGVKLQRPALTDEELAEQGSERLYLERDEMRGLFVGLDIYQEVKRDERRSSRAHGKAYLPDLDQVAFVDHVVPWILTMFYTGFRPGDLDGLQWPHVSPAFDYIRKTIEKTAHVVPEPQRFPISDAAGDVLRTWWEQCGRPSGGPVFPSPVTGGRLSRGSLRGPWAEIKRFGGLPADMKLYSLRHNFASQLVMAGVDLLTVSQLMSHTDIQTTIRYYAHLAPDHKRNAAQTFAAVASGAGADQPSWSRVDSRPASAVEP